MFFIVFTVVLVSTTLQQIAWSTWKQTALAAAMPSLMHDSAEMLEQAGQPHTEPVVYESDDEDAAPRMTIVIRAKYDTYGYGTAEIVDDIVVVTVVERCN